MVPELSICILSSELPFNGASPIISVTLQNNTSACRFCRSAIRRLRHWRVKTVFEFLPIQPADVLGCSVDLPE